MTNLLTCLNSPCSLIQTKNGETAYKPKQELHKVDGLVKYLRVMFIYGAAYLRKFPTKGPEFLQYLHSILDANKQYKWPTIYTYDQKFRLHRQKNPGHSWAQVNWEFHNELSAAQNIKEYQAKYSPNKFYKSLHHNRVANYRFQNSHNYGHGSSSSIGHASDHSQHKQHCCKDFNWSTCTRKECKFLHACKRCKGANHKTQGCLKN